MIRKMDPSRMSLWLVKVTIRVKIMYSYEYLNSVKIVHIHTNLKRLV